MDGENMDIRDLADMIGVKVDTLRARVMHGYTGYKYLRWEIDMDGYESRCKEWDAEELRKWEAREEEKDRRRVEVKARMEAWKKANADRLRKMHQDKREAFMARVEIIPRERKEGSPMLYLDGVRTMKREIPHKIGMRNQTMEILLRKGNFRFDGHLVEVRYQSREETMAKERQARAEWERRNRQERNERKRIVKTPKPVKVKKEPTLEQIARRDYLAKLKQMTKEEKAESRRRSAENMRKARKEKQKAPKPYRIEPYPPESGLNGFNSALCLNGASLERGTEKKLIGFGRGKAQELARIGRVVFDDGRVLEFLKRNVNHIEDDQRGPQIRPYGHDPEGRQKWGVRVLLGPGVKMYLFSSVHRDKAEEYLAECLKDEKWKKHQRVVDRI
jgi:hypothetical protein